MDKAMKTFKKLIPYIIVLIIVILVRTFIITPIRVSGVSMEPTLNNGSILLLNKIANVERLSVVVIDHDGERMIKRIIGLPGEVIELHNNNIYINGLRVTSEIGTGETGDMPAITLGDNQFFVLGDNRSDSKDSRYFGSINREDIQGVASITLWPLNDFGFIR